MAGRPGFCWCEIRPLEGIRADDWRRLGQFRVPRRINQRHARGAGFSSHWITRSRLTVEREPQDLAERLIRILSGRHALSITGRKEQVLAVGRKRDRGAELAASPLRHLTPQHLQVFETRRALSCRETRPREREARSRSLFVWLSVREIHAVVFRVMW